MLFKKIIKTVFILWVTVLVIYTFLTLGYFFIPHLVEKKLPSYLNKNDAYQIKELSIQKIGINRTILGPILIQTGGKKAIRVETIQIGYSIPQLMQKKITNVTLRGLAISISYNDSLVFLGGSDVKAFVSSLFQGGGSGADRPLSKDHIHDDSIPVEKITIDSGRIDFEWNDHYLAIPFDMEAVKVPMQKGKILVTFRLSVSDQKVNLSAVVDSDQKTLDVEMSALLSEIGQWMAYYIKTKPSVFLDDFHVDLSSKFKMRWDPFEIRELRGQLSFQKNKLIMSSSFRGNYMADGLFDFTLDSTDSGQAHPAFQKNGALRSLLKLSDFKAYIGIKGRKEKIEGSLSIDIPGGEFISENDDVQQTNKIRWNSLALKGALHWNKNSRNRKPLIQMTAMINELSGKLLKEDEPLIFSVPSLKLDGQSLVTEKNGSLPAESYIKKESSIETFPVPTGWIGTLSFSDARFEMEKKGLFLKGIAMVFPFSFPDQAHEKKGQLSISSAVYGAIDIGKLVGTLNHGMSKLSVDGRIFNTRILDGTLAFRGEVLLPPQNEFETNFHISAKKEREKKPFSLENYFPDTKGMMFNGNLDISGDIQTSKGGFEGNICGNLEKGVLTIEEKQISLSDISLKVCFPDLPSLRTYPKQLLKFQSLHVKDAKIDDGTIDFQMENDLSIFVEKGKFKWSNGQVYLQSTHLLPKKDTYHINLYCDRIDLANVLKQFGVANASGRGTVNGLIPVSYEKGRISLDGGFLYSTPGESGRIQLKDVDFLNQSSAGSLSQLDLAKEALKDFEYKWAKLSMETKGDDLNLKLQFDGKPIQPLPFVYHKEESRFIRIDSGSKGSVFQGISIDVNFRVPVDKLLPYKDLIFNK